MTDAYLTTNRVSTGKLRGAESTGQGVQNLLVQ